MSAGQSAVHPYSLAAISDQLSTPIYYPEFWRMARNTVRMLGEVMNTKSDVLLLAGSATYGIEAGLVTCMSEGDRILVVNSGVFGQVLAEVGRIVGLDVIELKVPYGRAVDPEDVRRLLGGAGGAKAKAVAVVHVETSTGVVNPVREIGEIARGMGLLFFVDAVSSAGSTDLRVDDWGIDLCFTSSQKAINAPQGMAIVAVGERAWAASRSRRVPARTLCLDLTVWKHNLEVDIASLDAWESGTDLEPRIGKAIHHPSISWALLRGLHGALLAILEEGLASVHHRHDVSAKAVRAGVRSMGLSVLADEEVACNVVTNVLTPDGVDQFELRRQIYQRYGIALAIGPLELGIDCFRIGQMGLVARPRYVIPTLSALESVLGHLGHPVARGSGVGAAQAVFDADW